MVEDLYLIFSNAMQFNLASSQIHKDAKTLQKFVESKLPEFLTKEVSNWALKSLDHRFVETPLLFFRKDVLFYYICSKTRLTENVFPLTLNLALTLTLTLTLKQINVFGPTKWRHFSRKYTVQIPSSIVILPEVLRVKRTSRRSHQRIVSVIIYLLIPKWTYFYRLKFGLHLERVISSNKTYL